MRLNIGWRSLGLALALVVVLVMVVGVVITGNSDAGENGIGYTSLVTTTPSPTPEPVMQSHNALLMIQGLVERRLVIWPVDGDQPPQEIDRYVNVNVLLADPTGSQVLYSAGNALMALDVSARRSRIVGEIPSGGKLTFAQWSPDSAAIAYVVQTPDQLIAYYTLADGTQEAEEMSRVTAGLPLEVAWMPEGQPVAISMGIGPVGGLEAQYRLYDPETGDLLRLPPDVVTIQPWSPWRSPDGLYQIVPQYNWADMRYSGTCKTGTLGLTGSNWYYVPTLGMDLKLEGKGFEIKRVFLNQPIWLDDGRILFRAMADEDCAPGQSGLYIGRLGSNPVQIVETITHYTSDDSDGYQLRGVSFALSPDQKAVAWAENDIKARLTTVFLTPINGGEDTILWQTTPPDDGATFAYQDSQVILGLIWLP